MRSADEVFQPVDIPRDASAMLSFTPDMQLEIDRKIETALADGRWKRPQNVPIDLISSDFWAYWISKSIRPVETPLDGTSLETHFRNESHSRYVFDDGRSDFTISFAGDLMRTPGLTESAASLYADVEELIFGTDISFGNLESTLASAAPQPLSFREGDAPSINLDIEEYRVLTSIGERRYDVLNLANNHILDCGIDGIQTTCDQLDKDGIQQVGINLPKSSNGPKPQISEHNGLRVGWVAHTFSVNFKPFPKGHNGIVNQTPFHLEAAPDLELIEQQIKIARDKKCDLIVVSLHWGLEFEFFPHPDQLSWARKIADAGADVIVGHHPHVVQPLEIYSPVTEPARNVPILYSLGNLTPVFSHPAMAMSFIARLGLSRASLGYAGRPILMELEIVPVALVSSLTAGKRQLHLQRLNTLTARTKDDDFSDYIREMARYADLVIGSGWRGAEQ